MSINPFAPDFNDLPDILPIFPLAGALLLPGGQLPLNIFEKRYMRMVDQALIGDRMIGMVQPREKDITDILDDTPVFQTGCAGKITAFNETEDGRYLVTLTGICRFNIAKERKMDKGFRRVKSDWAEYKDDLMEKECLGLNRERLLKLLQKYFGAQEIDCDWSMLENTTDGRLVTCLSMICPFSAFEKQALLEAVYGTCDKESRYR